jgi:hypothetical protein
MRLSLSVATIAIGAAVAAANPGLTEVKTVYLLPMSNSLDQYLANMLTRSGLLQVVTDPQKADAIFTDKIGQPFQDKMDELYPPAEQPKAEDDNGESKDPWGQPIQKLSTVSKGRGTVFLVDRQNRNVIWSIYSPVGGTQPNDVNRRATDITKKLQKDLQPKEHKETIPSPHQ